MLRSIQVTILPSLLPVCWVAC